MALLGAEAQLGLGDRFVQDVDAGLVRSRGGGIALHLVESSDGLVVGSVGASGFIIHIHRIGDEPYRTGYVVDHGDIGGQGKHGLRLAGLVRSFSSWNCSRLGQVAPHFRCLTLHSLIFAPLLTTRCLVS